MQQTREKKALKKNSSQTNRFRVKQRKYFIRNDRGAIIQSQQTFNSGNILCRKGKYNLLINAKSEFPRFLLLLLFAISA